MALDKYRQKRDFTQSPEPAGHDGTATAARRAKRGRTPRAFCVQKHLASHLHYDLRLEHNGVLLSWAVPKGPALDPAIKRLAMHVEDHPIEYGDFEGVIPSGYGAGIVMLWDRGTWTPEVDDVDAALAKGDLKFTLDGFKLKGSWVLVRTRGWGGARSGDDGRSWLLIKHKDEWSGALDIAEFAPLSVRSEGDFADILAQDNPDIWRSNRPAQSGDTGKLFQTIVRRAIALKHGGTDSDPAAPNVTASASAGAGEAAEKATRAARARATRAKKAKKAPTAPRARAGARRER